MAELEGLLKRIIQRIVKLLTRTGYLIEEQGMTYLAEAESDRALTPLQAARASALRRSMDFPARSMKAFGTARPSRSPRPAATMIATAPTTYWSPAARSSTLTTPMMSS